MDFTRINQVGLLEASLPVKRLCELELQKDYYITNIRSVQTTWGARIVVDVDSEFACYLPARLVKVFEGSDELFQQMSEAAANKNLIMQYYGTKFNKLEFKAAE